MANKNEIVKAPVAITSTPIQMLSVQQRMKQAVKRNPERFPEEFMKWRSQIVMSISDKHQIPRAAEERQAESTISYHISNIFKEGELDNKVVVRKIRITTPHGAMSEKTNGVKVEIYTKELSNALQLAESKFNDQYGGLRIHQTNAFHDRFLILDDKTIYLIGASLKDAGKRLFAFTQMDASQIKTILSHLR